jgi:preprotein translocase subunit SecE
MAKADLKQQGFDAKKAFTFFGNVKSEFNKVSWTTKEELKVYTKIVVIATMFLGVAIFCMDFIIRTGLLGMSRIFKFFAG